MQRAKNSVSVPTICPKCYGRTGAISYLEVDDKRPEPTEFRFPGDPASLLHVIANHATVHTNCPKCGTTFRERSLVEERIDDQWVEYGVEFKGEDITTGMNPDYVPKTLEQKLGYLIEECGEVLAAAGKTTRWGRESVNPELPKEEQETNADWLLREMRDLERAIKFVREELES